jgi:hypothetical protein
MFLDQLMNEKRIAGYIQISSGLESYVNQPVSLSPRSKYHFEILKITQYFDLASFGNSNQ